MRTKLITAGLLCSTLLAPAAMAQATPQSATSQQSPGSIASPSGNTNFITQLAPGTILASDLMDQDVVGPDGQDIGEVGNVILDRNGRVIALVIEVDDGLGDREVAVPMSAFQMSLDDQATTTGSVQNTNQPTGTTAARRSDDDKRIVLTIPMDQLKSAPEFEEDDD